MATNEMTQVIHAVGAEASRLGEFLSALEEKDFSKRSACDGWAIADVVAHLSQANDTWITGINRALAGDSSPPEGQRPLEPGERGSESTSERAIAYRKSQEVEGLVSSFISGGQRLQETIQKLKPEDWDKPCWHRRGVMPLSEYVARRVQELALHGWDIRSGLDDSAELWEETMPVVLGLVPRWLKNAFSPGLGLPTPMRYRFEVPGPIPIYQDILVNHDSFEVEEPGSSPADVTLRFDTSSYILLCYGRFNADLASVHGKLQISGRREQATLFTTWFRGF